METSNISPQVKTVSQSNISGNTTNQTLLYNNNANENNVTEEANSIKSTHNEELSPASLEKVAQQLQNFMSDMNKGLEFHVDEDSGRNVIKVVDKESGDLVKQYPSEEVLEIVSNLAKATGALVDFKV